jgi:cytosine/adenosine deaminase-related metal-dependent hydrolase
LIDLMGKNNLLGPDILLVHPQGMTADELKMIGETKSPWSTAPVIEMSYSAVRNGTIQFAELEGLGVPLGLSLDSSGASANADFFAVMRTLMQANWRRTDTELKIQFNPRRLVELATLEGARRLGVDDITGSLKPGKRADLILVRTSDINMAPFTDPAHMIVQSANPSNVDTVMIDGRVMKSGGKLVGIDVPRIVREAADTALRVREAAEKIARG